MTGAVWKCASSPENVERFQELGLVAILIKILKDNCDALDDLQVCRERKESNCCPIPARVALLQYVYVSKESHYFFCQFNPQKIGVLTNVVGAIAECAKTDANVVSIKAGQILIQTCITEISGAL